MLQGKWTQPYMTYLHLSHVHQNCLLVARWSLLAQVPHREWVYMMLRWSPAFRGWLARTVI